MAEKDPRTYIRVHDGMPDHPKIEPLSDAAFRLLVSIWCWSSRYLTDGRVSVATQAKRGKTKVWKELIDAGLADVGDDGSLTMHHYTEHQRTADEVRALVDAKAKGGELGNHIRWHQKRGITDPSCDRCTDANTDRTTDRKTIAPPVANASQNVAIDIDIDKDKNTATPSGFAEFWLTYPKKVGKPAAEKAYRKAVKDGADPTQLVLVAGRFAKRMADTDPKFICHPTTWLNQARYNDEPEPETAPAPRRYPPTEVPDWVDPDNPVQYAQWMRESMQ